MFPISGQSAEGPRCLSWTGIQSQARQKFCFPATVIVFEVVKVLLASERSVRETLLGAKQGS
jgi:hypothetical protein